MTRSWRADYTDLSCRFCRATIASSSPTPITRPAPSAAQQGAPHRRAPRGRLACSGSRRSPGARSRSPRAAAMAHRPTTPSTRPPRPPAPLPRAAARRVPGLRQGCLLPPPRARCPPVRRLLPTPLLPPAPLLPLRRRARPSSSQLPRRGPGGSLRGSDRSTQGDRSPRWEADLLAGLTDLPRVIDHLGGIGGTIGGDFGHCLEALARTPHFPAGNAEWRDVRARPPARTDRCRHRSTWVDRSPWVHRSVGALALEMDRSEIVRDPRRPSRRRRASAGTWLRFLRETRTACVA